MASILRKILPVAPSKNRDDGDGYSIEYSFASEYSGPPLNYTVPRAVPIDEIPTASVVSLADGWSNLSLPVIQPIVKSNPPSNKLSELKSGSEPSPSPTSGTTGFLKGREISCQPANLVDCSGDVDEPIPKISDGVGSSGSLGFSDSRDESQLLSESTEAEDLNEDGNEILDLDDGGLRPPALSSEISSPCQHVNGTSIVTSHDPESNVTFQEVTDYDDPEIIQRRLEAKINAKKGLCHRCLKRNRFVEKEVCLVCGAKYCGNCVLRAMGSMPEGRKCIVCIGYAIDESKRRALGKCSRVLKQLLSESEVKLIMQSEISCEVNQLPSRLVFVNGKRLSHAELVQLRTCQHPPKKLKPGRYWYDKVSGFWGKEGQKPCQIISAQLAVGDTIKRDCSNGNTNILLNNREITKSEHLMLKLAGIQCDGNPHFWVCADGSCQEEGQKQVIGKIWEKAGTRLACALLSLPTPCESQKPSGEEVDNVGRGVVPNYHEQNKLNKLLLVGVDKSGTSTIFKQAKMVYKVHFCEDERQNIKLMIQGSLYGYLGILLEGREQFEKECLIEMRKRRSDPGPSGSNGQTDERNIYSISPRLKAFSDWLLQVMISGNLEVIFPAASREYAPLVEELWNDKSFQATYNRRNELPLLPSVANYFLDRAVEISRTDYEPSDMDILYAEGTTSASGVASMEFSFPNKKQNSFMDPAEQHDPSERYQLIRVHASSLGENCKWLEMFEDVDLVVYCVDLTGYDEFWEDDNGVVKNKMLASKKLFETIITHPTFREKNFLLVLNKFDLLEEKIERFPLTQCDWFHDFNAVISHNQNSSSSNTNPSLAQRAFHYIAVKFKEIFRSLTAGRKLYVSLVTGLESDSVEAALKYAREILKWDVERHSISLPGGPDWSSGSIEASSSS